MSIGSSRGKVKGILAVSEAKFMPDRTRRTGPRTLAGFRYDSHILVVTGLAFKTGRRRDKRR